LSTSAGPAAARTDASRSACADGSLSAQLVAEGWLTARQGSGTRVADRPAPVPRISTQTAAEPASAPYDLTPGTPDLSLFPRTAWLAAAKRALTAAPNEALGYGDPRGRIELRRALADYLARARGVRAAPERILICSGYAQGLAHLAAALQAAEVRAGSRTGALDELILAELISSGAYDRHVRRARAHYRARRDRLVAALAEQAPRVRVTGIAAGLNALLELPPDAGSEEAVVARARAHGLAAEGLTRFRYAPAPGAPACLVVGYGTPPDHAFAGALAALCTSLATA